MVLCGLSMVLVWSRFDYGIVLVWFCYYIITVLGRCSYLVRFGYSLSMVLIFVVGMALV